MRTMKSPACMPASAAGEPSMRPQNLHPALLGDDFDADAGIGAHGREADLLEFLAVEVGRMRIERRDHAAHRFLHELVVVDLVDVLAFDALVDFGKEPRLLPGQGGSERSRAPHRSAGPPVHCRRVRREKPRMIPAPSAARVRVRIVIFVETPACGSGIDSSAAGCGLNSNLCQARATTCWPLGP